MSYVRNLLIAAVTAVPFHAVAEAPTSVSTSQLSDWSGGYAGGGISYSRMDVEDLTFGPGSFNANGAQLNGFVGYNFQSGNLVFGPEITVSLGSVDGRDGSFMEPFEAKHSIGLRGRIGYDLGNTLPYLAVGAVRTRYRADHDGAGDPADIASTNATGVSLALGADWRMSETMFLRVEIQHVKYSNRDLPFYGGIDPHEMRARENRAQVGVGFRF